MENIKIINSHSQKDVQLNVTLDIIDEKSIVTKDNDSDVVLTFTSKRNIYIRNVHCSHK